MTSNKDYESDLHCITIHEMYPNLLIVTHFLCFVIYIQYFLFLQYRLEAHSTTLLQLAYGMCIVNYIPHRALFHKRMEQRLPLGERNS